jgi:PIN domain nuclease of toxin-antitoxin system
VRLLVDTHVLIWALDEPTKLTPTVAASLQDPLNELYLSAATIWEMGIKIGQGKLTLSGPFRPWVEKAILDLDLILLPITVEVSDVQSRLPHHHGDPFDRMLVAQSQVEGIPLASKDAVFDQYGIPRLWD